MLEFLTAFWTCSIRFLRSWSGLSSAVAAALGALKSMGFEVPLPAWVWWSGAIAVLFVSAIFLEMSLQNERDKNKKTEPNFKLEELVRRIRGTDKLPGVNDPESIEILRVLELIRQKALLGIVDVFGCDHREWKGTQGVHRDMLPKHPIQREHWASHSMNCSEFLCDRLGLVCGAENGRTVDTYIMLWFDRSQVDRVWPPRRSIEWRLPF
jgi:hypothetical protein